MTDPAELSGPQSMELMDGLLTVEFTPRPGARMLLKALVNGDVIESGEYPQRIFGDRTLKGQFLNQVEQSLKERDGVDATKAKNRLREWFAEMHDLDREEHREVFYTNTVNAILDGTRYPVEVYGGETTVWNVELTFAGKTRELEFTASEMTTGNGNALEEKIANQFYEIIDIEPEDWQSIRQVWNEKSEEVAVVDHTAEDAVADRVLSKLSNAVKPVPDQDSMGNDVAAAWFDAENAASYEGIPSDAAILWVQDDFVVDQIEATGKSIEHKGNLIKKLIQRGDLWGKTSRRRWAWDGRRRVYPFVPESLGVSSEDVGTVDDPNHSEVSA